MDAATLVIMKNEIKKLSERVDDLSDMFIFYYHVILELERRIRDLEKTNETTHHDYK